MSAVYNRLVPLAGLTPEMIKLGKEDPQFDAILEALRDIHRGKEVLYGNYLETRKNDNFDWTLIEHFLDMKRKYIRAEQFVKSKENLPIDELLETYSDLAVYAIMGIQVCLSRIEEVRHV